MKRSCFFAVIAFLVPLLALAYTWSVRPGENGWDVKATFMEDSREVVVSLSLTPPEKEDIVCANVRVCDTNDDVIISVPVSISRENLEKRTLHTTFTAQRDFLSRTFVEVGLGPVPRLAQPKHCVIYVGEFYQKNKENSQPGRGSD
ncbi:MAG: hypothetical protein AAB393_09375 [Bacteroidota bacterium]